jgi:hypothetical protein
VLFAVGAVSGTVLSFELGLLFPRFMEHAGPIVGMPFSLEGFAFFTEAIFLGLYLYGWDKLRPAMHVFAGIVVAVSGLASAVFVTFVNAWMNAPRGFTLEGGKLVDIDPYGALHSPFALHEIPHTALAAYAATGFAVAGIHAWALRKRGPNARTECARQRVPCPRAEARARYRDSRCAPPTSGRTLRGPSSRALPAAQVRGARRPAAHRDTRTDADRSDRNPGHAQLARDR